MVNKLVFIFKSTKFLWNWFIQTFFGWYFQLLQLQLQDYKLLPYKIAYNSSNIKV